MTRTLLFCVAEEAKGATGIPSRIFWLVESRAGPSNNDHPFKLELKENEAFETDFIGASQQDCQQWAIEQQNRYKFIEQNIIGIVDARSAKDGTILMSHFFEKIDPPFEFEGYGPLPEENDIWYDYRIPRERAADVNSALMFVAPDCTWPAYFGLKEQLTDEHGVFDVARAERLAIREEAVPKVD
ncbi:MAG: hypothetical protein Q9160_002525 [Pyrenula sp. 1 TL-2023]